MSGIGFIFEYMSTLDTEEAVSSAIPLAMRDGSTSLTRVSVAELPNPPLLESELVKGEQEEGFI